MLLCFRVILPSVFPNCATCVFAPLQAASRYVVRSCILQHVIFLTQVMLLCRCKLWAWKVSSPVSMPHFQHYGGRRTLVGLNVHQDLLFVPGLVQRSWHFFPDGPHCFMVGLSHTANWDRLNVEWSACLYLASTTTYSRSLLSRETAKFLAAQGASVILGCRNVDRGLEAAADIREVENLVFGPVKWIEQRFLEVTCAT
jgi:hypothetical protein